MSELEDVLSLHERVALITGAARGIGAATARLFARAGARVALLDREREPLDALARQITDADGRAMPLTADVTDDGAVRAAVGRVIDTWHRVDVLVNNAGVLRDARLEKVADEDWSLTLDVNARGAMACARAVVPHMLAAGSGRILSATSVSARSGNFGQTVYSASKGAIIGMTHTWARELGPKGITANAVAPGFIDTDMTKSVPPKVIERLLARLPAGRLGTADEVAAVYLFLASDLAGFMNGAIVGVDGGALL
jgi:3-oxoacyl-[acyl-carrier protein] reductase